MHGPRSRAPRKWCFIASFILGKAFLSASAHCSSIQTNSIMIFPPSIHHWMKWSHLSICLFNPWNTWFSTRAMKDLLSMNKYTSLNSYIVSCPNKPHTHNSKHIVAVVAICLASHDDKAIAFYFWENSMKQDSCDIKYMALDGWFC